MITLWYWRWLWWPWPYVRPWLLVNIFWLFFQNSSSSPAVTSTEKHRLSDQGSHTPTSSKRMKTENDKSARLVSADCSWIAVVILNAIICLSYIILFSTLCIFDPKWYRHLVTGSFSPYLYQAWHAFELNINTIHPLIMTSESPAFHIFPQQDGSDQSDTNVVVDDDGSPDESSRKSPVSRSRDGSTTDDRRWDVSNFCVLQIELQINIPLILLHAPVFFHLSVFSQLCVMHCIFPFLFLSYKLVIISVVENFSQIFKRSFSSLQKFSLKHRSTLKLPPQASFNLF